MDILLTRCIKQLALSPEVHIQIYICMDPKLKNRVSPLSNFFHLLLYSFVALLVYWDYTKYPDTVTPLIIPLINFSQQS